MANTQFSEIYDLFMQTVTDYRLIDLFDTSQIDFENYLQAFMKFAINDFKNCDQSLSFSGSATEFSTELTDENKIMIATLMTKHWLKKNINDITQMNLHVTDRDFKVASEAANLREKKEYMIVVMEECAQKLVDYGLARINWTNWYNQIFSGG